METIKINDMQTKGVVFIVKYDQVPEEGKDWLTNQEATLNVYFNDKEIAYLLNFVGIGGTVSVEIREKEKQAGNPSAGFWVNITKVDMKSAVKGATGGHEDWKGQVDRLFSDVDPPKAGLMTPKDIMISSLALTKAWAAATKADSVTPREVLEAYRFFILELEQNG